MVTTPQAVWFTDGTPKQVEKAVKKVMAQAALERRIPVLVAYNVPTEIARSTRPRRPRTPPPMDAWIDGFAKGIGQAQATVILEPDRVGIIPYNTTIYGTVDSCQPTVLAADGSSVPAPGRTRNSVTLSCNTPVPRSRPALPTPPSTTTARTARGSAWGKPPTV